MKKVLLATLAAISICLSVNAQKISNVQWKQDANNLIINYRISGLTDDIECSTSLYVSFDGGKTQKGPLTKVSGDLGTMESNGEKSITWQVFEEMGNEELSGELVFEVKTDIKRKPLPTRTLIAYSYSPKTPVALMYGSGKRLAWYVKAKSNLHFDSKYDYNAVNGSLPGNSINLSSYSVSVDEASGNKIYSTFDPNTLESTPVYRQDNNGNIYDYYTNSKINTNPYNGYIVDNYDKNGYYTFTGNSKSVRYAAMVGASFEVISNIYLTAGVGYGLRQLMWEIEETSYDTGLPAGTSWVKIEDSSGKGLEWEIGAMYRYKFVVGMVNFAKLGSYKETSVGLGVMF